jgi:CheY-like chemotaxis protein
MSPSEQEFQGARILIVDDQAANIQLLERLLAQAGYADVHATSDPHGVGALHREHDFDLILLDLQMPGMDGFQVMATLQTSPATSYLPVIVLTAQPGHKLRALQAGAKDFISKPFDLIEVTTRIRNMLEVRLMHRRLEAHNQELERLVEAKTAELRESEARYRSLTELATDWYWEQDESGRFTRVAGPVLEMLGVRVEALDAPASGPAREADLLLQGEGWNEEERSALRAAIAARKPFLDFAFSRAEPDGTRRHFRVSGEPIFGRGCRYIGYRGVGIETTAGHHLP